MKCSSACIEEPMNQSIREILNLYNPADPLEKASTIPAPWYRDVRVHELELAAVFAKSWQVAGRLDQVHENGAFFTTDIAGEPIIVVRGEDARSEEHTSELQSRSDLVCRLLLE